MTRDDIEIDDLHDLLRMWHRYEARWVPVDGYPTECPSTAGYRASRQYDGDNGAADSDAMSRLMRHVGDVVNAMPEPHRTAIRLIARNKATGFSVWGSARLPADRTECAQVLGAAIEIFAARI